MVIRVLVFFFCGYLHISGSKKDLRGIDKDSPSISLMNMHTLHLAVRIPANVKPPKAEDWYTELC